VPSLVRIVPAKPPTRNLSPLRSSDVLISLRNHPPHLRAGIGGSETDPVVVFQEIVQQFLAAAVTQPGDHLAAVESERKRRAERKGRILAPVVIHGRVAHLDCAALHGIENLQARNDLACGENLDLEFVIGDFGNALREVFAAAVERIERFRPARCQSPFHFRRRLRNCGGGNSGCGSSQTGSSQEFTTFHWRFPSLTPGRRPKEIFTTEYSKLAFSSATDRAILRQSRQSKSPNPILNVTATKRRASSESASCSSHAG
jgi:hypothetical protein